MGCLARRNNPKGLSQLVPQVSLDHGDVRGSSEAPRPVAAAVAAALVVGLLRTRDRFCALLSPIEQETRNDWRFSRLAAPLGMLWRLPAGERCSSPDPGLGRPLS